MATINAVAHKNELTQDDPDDYYLQMQVRATLSVEDIVKRIADREIAVTSVNGTTFVKLFLKECEAASAEGNNIVTSFFRSSIGIKGVVHSQDLGHDIAPSRLKVSVDLTQGVGAIEAIGDATVHVFEQPGATGPVIQLVTDPTDNTPDNLSFRGMALIQGMRLALRGDNAAVGITFTPADAATGDTPVFIPAGKVSPNTPGQLQFVLPPEVTAGSWRVRVTTQYSSSKDTKEPRSYEYGNVVLVS